MARIVTEYKTIRSVTMSVRLQELTTTEGKTQLHTFEVTEEDQSVVIERGPLNTYSEALSAYRNSMCHQFPELGAQSSALEYVAHLMYVNDSCTCRCVHKAMCRCAYHVPLKWREMPQGMRELWIARATESVNEWSKFEVVA